jgi:DNA-binding NarL/FixJ family response regulator
MTTTIQQRRPAHEREATAARIRVLIADDHPLILAGIRRTVERYDDIELVGEARTGPELIALIERRRPALVLTDLWMPGLSGVELVAAIRHRWPQLKIVVLSASEEPATIDAALHAGANAYALKSADTVDLALLLRQVSSATVFLAPTPPARPAAAGRQRSALPGLTDRERSILAAVASGMKTAAISRELWISEHTVKFHLTNIYRKLGVSNRAGAIRYALEHDLAA